MSALDAPSDGDRRAAVVLFSGGLDSTTLLAHVVNEGYRPHTLSIDYGQKNRQELRCAKALAARFGVVEHRVFQVDRVMFGGSALTDPARPVPHRDRDPLGTEGPPPTYVPGRNTVFLSMAAAWAESLGVPKVFIGISVGDVRHAGDCSPAYIAAYNSMLAVALTPFAASGRVTVQVEAPFLTMTKAEIIGLGLSLGVDYAETHTCYDPTRGSACGTCDACLARRHGFALLGMRDPVGPAPLGGQPEKVTGGDEDGHRRPASHR